MAEIEKHRYYSNGAYGRSWGVRMVTDIIIEMETGQKLVAFKGVAGICRRKIATQTLAEFEKWAKHEVALNENSWQRVQE